MMYCIIAIVIIVGLAWYLAMTKNSMFMLLLFATIIPVIIMLTCNSAPRMNYYAEVVRNEQNKTIYFDEYLQQDNYVFIDDYYTTFDGVWGLGWEHHNKTIVIDSKGKDFIFENETSIKIKPEVVNECE